MKIILILLLICIWVVLNRYNPIESYITKENNVELTDWFDKATELKTVISGI